MYRMMRSHRSSSRLFAVVNERQPLTPSAESEGRHRESVCAGCQLWHLVRRWVVSVTKFLNFSPTHGGGIMRGESMNGQWADRSVLRFHRLIFYLIGVWFTVVFITFVMKLQQLHNAEPGGSLGVMLQPSMTHSNRAVRMDPSEPSLRATRPHTHGFLPVPAHLFGTTFYNAEFCPAPLPIRSKSGAGSLSIVTVEKVAEASKDYLSSTLPEHMVRSVNSCTFQFALQPPSHLRDVSVPPRSPGNLNQFVLEKSKSFDPEELEVRFNNAHRPIMYVYPANVTNKDISKAEESGKYSFSRDSHDITALDSDAIHRILASYNIFPTLPPKAANNNEPPPRATDGKNPRDEQPPRRSEQDPSSRETGQNDFPKTPQPPTKPGVDSSSLEKSPTGSKVSYSEFKFSDWRSQKKRSNNDPVTSVRDLPTNEVQETNEYKYVEGVKYRKVRRRIKRKKLHP